MELVEAGTTLRAMRRLKPDPLLEAVIRCAFGLADALDAVSGVW